MSKDVCRWEYDRIHACAGWFTSSCGYEYEVTDWHNFNHCPGCGKPIEHPDTCIEIDTECHMCGEGIKMVVGNDGRYPYGVNLDGIWLQVDYASSERAPVCRTCVNSMLQHQEEMHSEKAKIEKKAREVPRDDRYHEAKASILEYGKYSVARVQRILRTSHDTAFYLVEALKQDKVLESQLEKEDDLD